jgi:hypothetical protein
MKISVEKVDKGVILAEDGCLYNIESGPSLASHNQSVDQQMALNDSYSHSGGFAGQYGGPLMNNLQTDS